MNNTSIPATIDLFDTVNDVVARYPATVGVFRKYGIDACCGGAQLLVTVTSRHRIDADVLLVALRTSVS